MQKKVYVKKGESQPEESKKEIVQEDKEARGTGYGRGRGGKSNRPYTQQEKRPYYQKKGEGQDGDGEYRDGKARRYPREDRGRQEHDENSFYYKYHYGERPTIDRKVKVTLETEIPEMIPKDSRLKNPDNQEYDSKMKQFSNQIEDLKNKRRHQIQKKKEFLEGGTIGNTKVTFKDYISEKLDELKKAKDAKRAVLEKMDDIKFNLEKLEEEKQFLRKTMSRDFQQPAEIQAQIEELQRKYETTSLSKDAERKTINDIKMLKNSLPNAQKLYELKPEIDKLYERRLVLRDELNRHKDVIQKLSVDLEGVRKQQEDVKTQRSDIQDQVKKFDEQITKIDEDIQKIFTERNEAREKYFEQKLEYEIQKDQIAHIEWMQRQKSKLQEREEYKKKIIEERKQQMKDRPNPFEREIEMCEHLIAYLQKKKVDFGLVEEKEVSTLEVEKSMFSQFAKEDVNKKINDGKLERSKTKAEKEAEEKLVIGGKKKKGGKKHKDTVVQENFQIDIGAVSKFSYLKISPPLNTNDLDPKLKELHERKNKYITEGEQKLKDDQENVEDFDVEKYIQEEENKKDDYEPEQYNRGRGRGSYRANGRGSYRGRGEGRRDRDRNEYEGNDDDEYQEEKKPQAKRQNKKENLHVTEDNFPDL